MLSRDFNGFNPFVAGWGTTNKNGQLSPVLMQLQVPVIDRQKCIDLATQIGITIANVQIRDSVICAGKYGGKNFWDGDSGGPLMLPIHQNGTSFPVYQIGIVSFSYSFAQENVPGIYTKVQYYADWIKKQLQSSTHWERGKNRNKTEFVNREKPIAFIMKLFILKKLAKDVYQFVPHTNKIEIEMKNWSSRNAIVRMRF